MIKYSLLFLTYNNRQKVMRCFETLRATLERADVECIVLDNGSDDGTPELLMSEYGKHLRMIRSPENLGVSGGRAELLKHATGEILLFLDSDVWVTDPQWLEKITAPLADADVGMVGVMGCTVDWLYPLLFKPSPEGECDVVSGWCQVFRRDLLNAGLHLDTDYGLFWTEDSDFCLQIQDMGFFVRCVHGAGIHHIAAESGKHLADMQANHARFRAKWQGKGLVKAEGGY